MIQFLKNHISFEDERGIMKGIINFGKWEELNFFRTKQNQIRGLHYHKVTDELFIILKGKIIIELSSVNFKGQLIGESKSILVKKDDVFIIPKNTYHIFKIIEDSEWINALSQKIESENPDIHKIINS